MKQKTNKARLNKKLPHQLRTRVSTKKARPSYPRGAHPAFEIYDEYAYYVGTSPNA
jgi:hypothetical protein